MSKFWLWDFYWNHRETRRSPENYAAYVRKFAAEPQSVYYLQNSAKAGAYPEGPDDGWRYKFERLPVHDKLLNAYKLDKIAGQGDTFTRALRVMGWLTAHTWYCGMSFWSIRFNDSYFSGKRFTSLHLLRWAYDKPFSRSINCGHKAYLLADCLLAAGISAIPVSFQNYVWQEGEADVTPRPNHSVAHVWLPEESRWVMLDPSMDSYIADDAGRALNLVEIQERHRQGKELRVAQYNFNGSQDGKQEYLESFVLGSLLEIMVEDGTRRNGFLRNLLLPEGVPKKSEKRRAITAAELLAEPMME